MLVATVSQAQFTIKDISGESAYDNDDVKPALHFPVLSSVDHAAAAERINFYLQINELNLLIGHQAKSPFELVYYADYKYEIIANTDRLFSIAIHQQNCNMRCVPSDTYYAFDARSGDLITLDALFIKKVQGDIQKILLSEYKERIKQHLGDPTYANEYKDCLEQANDMSELEIYQFKLTPSAIEFYAGQCLDVTEQEGDTRGPYERPYKAISNVMTSYANQLLLGGVETSRAVRLLNRVLKGKIDNKYPFTMVLLPPYSNDTPNAIRGAISYDKYGKRVDIVGTMTSAGAADKVTINELDQGNKVSEITAVFDGQHFRGTFKNLRTGKVMPIEAE